MWQALSLRLAQGIAYVFRAPPYRALDTAQLMKGSEAELARPGTQTVQFVQCVLQQGQGVRIAIGGLAQDIV